MRRALATFLLAVMSFPLVGAPLFVQALPGVPACCLRNGQHHCEAAGIGSFSGGPAVVSARCPLWPGPAIASREIRTPLPAARPQIGSPLLRRPAFFASCPRPFRPTAKDSSKKRGPPFLLD
jgi:hypothetical protein